MIYLGILPGTEGINRRNRYCGGSTCSSCKFSTKLRSLQVTMVQGCYLGVKFKFASGRMLCDIVFPTNNILGAAQSNALDPNVIMHFYTVKSNPQSINRPWSLVLEVQFHLHHQCALESKDYCLVPTLQSQHPIPNHFLY